jgi:hypothetical protein
VSQDKRIQILKKDAYGVRKRFFSNTYDKILQFAKGGL